MPNVLVVTRPFGTKPYGPYQVGDHITDSAAIAKILKSSNHAKVVAVSGENLPKPPGTSAPAPEVEPSRPASSLSAS